MIPIPLKKAMAASCKPRASGDDPRTDTGTIMMWK